MKRKYYFWLFLAGLAVSLAVGAFQHSAGYLDADYYYEGGIRLVQGYGFSEIVLWNYLDDPQTLPHPSNGYWYPLASIIAAAGMLLGRSINYESARMGFILIGALVAPVTAALALRLTKSIDPQGRPHPELAITAGALALFPTYLTASIPAVDNYAIFMVLGGLFMILADRGGGLDLFLAGVCAGLMSLARSDGILWAAAGLVFIGARYLQRKRDPKFLSQQNPFTSIGFFLFGFFLLAIPWYTRNLLVFGSPLTAGGGRALYLSQYADTFAYPASRLTAQNLLSEGWRGILAARWHAFVTNLDATLTIQIGLLLFPFALIGIWSLRRQLIVQVGILLWGMLLLAMSLVFPFAGPRGSFTHAGAALYPLWWSVSVAGLGASFEWLEKRGYVKLASRRVLVLSIIVLLNAVFSIYMTYVRIGPLDWDRFSRIYAPIEKMIVQDGSASDTAVIVIDPPGYFNATGRPAIIIPDENKLALLTLAEKFNAGYLVLEKEHLKWGGIEQLYNSPYSDPNFEYIGQVEDAKLYRIER